MTDMTLIYYDFYDKETKHYYIANFNNEIIEQCNNVTFKI